MPYEVYTFHIDSDLRKAVREHAHKVKKTAKQLINDAIREHVVSVYPAQIAKFDNDSMDAGKGAA